MKSEALLQEIRQGEKIQEVAARVWGWETPAGVFRVMRRVEEFSRYLRKNTGGRCLEIGCGTGVFTGHLRSLGLEVIGLDISFDLLKKAREKHPGIRFIQADAENLPFKNNAFDFVLGVSVLHHLSAGAALKSIRRVLKPKGSIIFSEPNGANPQIFLQKRIPLLKKMLLDTPQESAFLGWKLKRLLLKGGFANIAIKPFEFLHPYTPKGLIGLIRRLERHLERLPFIREIAGSLLVISEKGG